MTPLCGDCIRDVVWAYPYEPYRFLGPDGEDCTHLGIATLLVSISQGEGKYRMFTPNRAEQSPVAVTTLDGRPLCVAHAVGAKVSIPNRRY